MFPKPLFVPLRLNKCLVSGPKSVFFLQMQATVLGLLAALAAVFLGWVLEGYMLLNHAALLCSASVTTAFLASLLQGKETS